MNRVTIPRPVSLVLAFVCLVAAAGCATARPAPQRPLVFSAMGDGPRADDQWPIMRKQLADVNAEGRSAFILHVGDICAGANNDLPEEYFIRVAEMLQASDVPIFIVPGDNEWNDQLDPDKGWANWEKHILGIDRHWPDAPKARHQKVRPENLAFVTNGVLFVGLNLVGGRVHDPDEWALRHKQDAAWVRQNLQRHRNGVRAAVVFAQANPNKKHEDFMIPFRQAAKDFGKPVLFLHGDGHHWQVDRRWPEKNILRVQVDMVVLAPPVEVTVTLDPKEPFTFDRKM